MAPAENPDELMASKPVHVGDLDTLSLGIAFDQVLSPTTIATLGYDAALTEGFTSNPYRAVAYADGGGSPENHPAVRTRNAYYLWLAQYVTPARLALRVGYRFYRDSWQITAHTPEVRLHQELGDYVEFRIRYRYYTQTSSSFWRKGGNLRNDRYLTADPKMSPFHDQTLGGKLRISLDFLSFTSLDFAHRAVVDFGVDYIFQNSNRFGKGVIGQGGFTWPF
jgi:hypothetical protein